eukprot:Colp12_sorted_trinity150504_noHs@18038
MRLRSLSVCRVAAEPSLEVAWQPPASMLEVDHSFEMQVVPAPGDPNHRLRVMMHRCVAKPARANATAPAKSTPSSTSTPVTSSTSSTNATPVEEDENTVSSDYRVLYNLVQEARGAKARFEVLSAADGVIQFKVMDGTKVLANGPALPSARMAKNAAAKVWYEAALNKQVPSPVTLHSFNAAELDRVSPRVLLEYILRVQKRFPVYESIPLPRGFQARVTDGVTELARGPVCNNKRDAFTEAAKTALRVADAK